MNCYFCKLHNNRDDDDAVKDDSNGWWWFIQFQLDELEHLVFPFYTVQRSIQVMCAFTLRMIQKANKCRDDLRHSQTIASNLSSDGGNHVSHRQTIQFKILHLPMELLPCTCRFAVWLHLVVGARHALFTRSYFVHWWCWCTLPLCFTFFL